MARKKVEKAIKELAEVKEEMAEDRREAEKPKEPARQIRRQVTPALVAYECSACHTLTWRKEDVCSNCGTKF